MGLQTRCFGLTKKENYLRALILMSLGNSFLFVVKTILNEEAASKEKKELMGLLQARNNRIRQQRCSPYRLLHNSSIGSMPSEDKVLLTHLLWNNSSSLDFGSNTLFQCPTPPNLQAKTLKEIEQIKRFQRGSVAFLFGAFQV